MSRTMSRTQSEILDAVTGNSRPTIQSLAWNIGIAEASVRRDIQVLRRLGHNIVCNNDGDQWGGPTYSLVVAAATPVAEETGTQVAL